MWTDTHAQNAAPAPPAWLRVVVNNAPFLTQPQDSYERLLAVMPSGLLVEDRPVETRASMKAQAEVKTLKFDQAWPDVGRVQWEGDLRMVSLTGDQQGWTYASAVAPLGMQLAPKGAICAAFGQRHGTEDDLCLRSLQLLLLRESPLQVAALVGRMNRPSLVAALSMDGTRVAVGAATEVRAVAGLTPAGTLPDGRAVVMAEEPLREPGATGFQRSLFVATRDAELRRAGHAVTERSEPGATVMKRTFARVRVERGAAGPVLTVEGQVLERDQKTGAELSRRPYRELLTWDSSKEVFVVKAVEINP